jgi:hypothetical protein
MQQFSMRGVAAGIVLPLLLMIGAAPAFAHGKQPALNQSGPGGHFAPIQGTVTGWNAGNGALQIQTKTGGVTISVTSATQVIRMVAGSMADLHAKEQVVAHLVQGTTTIDSLHIDAATKPKDQHPHLNGSKPAHPKPHPESTRLPKSNTRHPGPGVMGQVSGQVSDVGTNTLTLVGWNSKSTTYPLSNKLKITKAVNGSTGDIAIGETVRATRGANGNAESIVIINA